VTKLRADITSTSVKLEPPWVACATTSEAPGATPKWKFRKEA